MKRREIVPPASSASDGSNARRTPMGVETSDEKAVTPAPAKKKARRRTRKTQQPPSEE